MNLARTVGCSKIEINSDSAEVITALQDGNSSSIASFTFDDCYYMSLDFNHIIYEHCIRESNQVTHELARIARFAPSNVSMDYCKEPVVSMIVDDATTLMNE